MMRKEVTGLKRTLFLFAISLIFLLSLSIVSSASDSNKVAYIYKKNFKIDQNIIDVFTSLGLQVELIQEDVLFSKDLSQYRFLFVGDENFKKNIPVNNYPSVVANYYLTDSWGLTDNEGTSQLGATSPLSVLINSHKFQVYNSAFFKQSATLTIPYYYLEKNNKAISLRQIAATETTSSGFKVGDVISYADKGSQLMNGKRANENICFYGIIESDYWTQKAKDLFAQCAGFVGSSCSDDSQCASIPDSALYCGSDNNVYKNTSSATCQNPNTLQASCNVQTTPILQQTCQFGCSSGACLQGIHDLDFLPISSQNNEIKLTDSNDLELSPNNLTSGESYKIKIQIKNIGNFTENITFSGVITNTTSSISFSHVSVTNLAPQDETSEKTKTVVFNLASGNYNITIDAFVPSSTNPIESTTLEITLLPAPVIICSQDIDCGIDGFIGSLMCSGNNVIQEFQNFTCQNPGTPQSSCSLTIQNQTQQVCQNFCSNGQCGTFTCNTNSDCDDTNNHTLDICNLPGTPQSQCAHTPIECLTDSECNDFNPLTFDQCINAGTIISDCRNTPINCASDLDCGSTGLIGQEFCVEKNVTKNFQNSTCQNPGTLISSCQTSTSPQVTSQCDLACSQGQCIQCNTNLDCNDTNINTIDICNNPGTPQSFCENPPIACLSDPDCNDNNITTLDICNLPGTQTSFCTNTPIDITCSQNSDCGIDGFINQPFCVEDNKTQFFQTFTCLDAGLVTSSCTSSVSQQLIEQCSDLCSNGQCITIACYTDPDCDDSNNQTTDVCHNPGQVTSFCTNNPIPQIECFQDSDCGTKTTLSQQFCSLNKVNQLVRTWTCNNPGEEISYCSSDIEIEEINQCLASEFCTNGQCVPVECSSPADCNDSNDYTADICNLPGTPQSFCENPPIECLSDLDCDDLDVTTQDTCQNPGELISECRNDHIPECSDTIDNDNDGFIDFPADIGCSSPNDDDESDDPVPECSDGIDNDNDGATDYPQDFSCSSPNDDDETNPLAECQDLLDNDNDNTIDFPEDIGCLDPQDNNEEFPECVQDTDCDDPSSIVSCNGINLINTTTTYSCQQGQCVPDLVIDDHQICQFGCSQDPLICLSDPECVDGKKKIIDFRDTNFLLSTADIDNQWPNHLFAHPDFIKLDPNVKIIEPIRNVEKSMYTAIEIENDGIIVFNNRMRDGGFATIVDKDGNAYTVLLIDSKECPGGDNSACIYSRDGKLLFSYAIESHGKTPYANVLSNKKYTGLCQDLTIAQAKDLDRQYCGLAETQVELKAGDTIYFRGEDSNEPAGTGLEVYEYC